VSRVAVVLPSDPVSYDKIHGCGYDEDGKILVVGVEGDSVQQLEVISAADIILYMIDVRICR
jgi:hypothetical protein